jgi:MFS family permease
VQKGNRLFVACVLALVATSFGFILRVVLLHDIGVTFNLTQTQEGALGGAGLFPFALSIIFFSLIIDKIGYGTAMACAWIGHVVSAVITITAHSYQQLYVGTLIFALANGTIEAVVNPVVTTLFSQNKTHRLNILHSGWAGGLVLGGLLAIAMAGFGWRWKIGLFLLPALVYGALMIGQRFPVQERVSAGVSYAEMLKEFGWARPVALSSSFLSASPSSRFATRFKAIFFRRTTSFLPPRFIPWFPPSSLLSNISRLAAPCLCFSCSS